MKLNENFFLYYPNLSTYFPFLTPFGSKTKKLNLMKSIHILLVEDNEGDIMLTTEALEEGRIANKISVVKDGKNAIDFLNKKGDSENASLPDLI